MVTESTQTDPPKRPRPRPTADAFLGEANRASDNPSLAPLTIAESPARPQYDTPYRYPRPAQRKRTFLYRRFKGISLEATSHRTTAYAQIAVFIQTIRRMARKRRAAKMMETKISQSLLSKAEKELVAHIKSLPAFHSCISELVLCSKEGGAILQEQNALALFAKNYTPVLRKVIFNLVSVIESLSFDEICESIGPNCATITVCRMLASRTRESDIPGYFFWAIGHQDGIAMSFHDGESKRKMALVYLLIVRVLLSRLLLRPLETNLVNRYNSALARNLKSAALFIYFIAFKAVCSVATEAIPNVPICSEFQNAIDCVIEDAPPIGALPGQVFDQKFVKMWKQLPKIATDDAQQRIANWTQAMFIDLKNSAI